MGRAVSHWRRVHSPQKMGSVYHAPYYDMSGVVTPSNISEGALWRKTQINVPVRPIRCYWNTQCRARNQIKSNVQRLDSNTRMRFRQRLGSICNWINHCKALRLINQDAFI